MSVQGQAPTGQPVPPPAEKKPARRNPILGYIEDSYNGLYKIVIEPSMPTKQTVILLVVGLIVGLIWGWGIRPVEFYDASPNQLSQAAQDQWIKSVAVAHDTQTFYPDDRATALLMVVSDPASAVTRMLLDAGIDPADAAALQSLKPITDQIPASSTPAKVEPRGLVDDIISLLIPIILIVVVTPILVVVWRLLIKDNIIAPIQQRIVEARNPQIRKDRLDAAAERERIRKQREEAERLRKEAEAQRIQDEKEGRGDAYGAPAMQALYIYSKGRSFDESTEIEVGAAKEFLGQCGAVIAEAVDPDPTAIEVWLFDMFDQVNIKKVIVTETAYGNAATRAAIEDSVDNPSTDVVVAKSGVSVILETQKLRLQAKMPSVTVSPDGRFENFQMQVQAWDKSKIAAGAPVAAAPVGAAAPAPLSFDAPPPPRPAAPAPLPPAPAPTGARPLSSYDDIQFDPPPMSAPRQAPAPLPPAPAPTGARPLSSYDDIQFDPPPAAPLRPAAPPPAPAGARPLSSYDDIQFDPPPAAPLSAPRPAPLQPLRPAAPPPAPGFGDEDDPFGNTGDFTPLGKH